MTGNANVEAVRRLDAGYIVQLHQKEVDVDASRFERGFTLSNLYRCNETVIGFISRFTWQAMRNSTKSAKEYLGSSVNRPGRNQLVEGLFVALYTGICNGARSHAARRITRRAAVAF